MASAPRNTFGDVLKTQLDARGMSLRAFARAVEAVPGFIGDCMAGRRRPPPDRLPSWADALKLTGEDRELFLEAGLLARCAPALRDHVATLRRERDEARAEVTALRKGKKAGSPNLRPHGLAN